MFIILLSFMFIIYQFFVKISVEMCPFIRIPMTRLNVSISYIAEFLFFIALYNYEIDTQQSSRNHHRLSSNHRRIDVGQLTLVSILGWFSNFQSASFFLTILGWFSDFECDIFLIYTWMVYNFLSATFFFFSVKKYIPKRKINIVVLKYIFFTRVSQYQNERYRSI